MDMYNNNLMPAAMLLALSDNDFFHNDLSDLTESEKEEIINRARDSKSEEELKIILNELSVHNRS